MHQNDAERRAAIDSAFRDESAMLLRWLTAKLGNRDDAQDVLQTVYLRALTFAAENSIENAKALIFRIAAHLAVDELRRRRRHRAHHLGHEDSDAERLLNTQMSEAPSSERHVISREELRVVMKVLDKLPRKAKTAFLMNRVYGNTYSEIAESLGVSVSSVEKYITKALAALQTLRTLRNDLAAKKARYGDVRPSFDFLTFAARRHR